jgi:hypothetical protein
MKKVLTLLAMLGLAASVNAGQFKSYSFFNNNVSSIMVSNNIGATNLLSQLLNVGPHWQTNTIGGNAVNYAYTNGVPFNASVSNNYYNAQSLLATQTTANIIGTMIVDTKTNISSTWSYTGTLGISARTNDNQNMFADVPLNTDANFSNPPFNQSQNTNILGTITVTSIGDTVFTSGTAGGGSNIVNLIFVPVWDGVHESTVGTDAFKCTYTNQSTVLSLSSVPPFYLPNTFTFQVSAAQFAGCAALRLKSITTGTSTNAIWIQGVTFNDWVP